MAEPELHFYPGEKRVIFFVEGKPVLKAEAWGGPPAEAKAGPGEKFGAGPTDAGRFVIFGAVRYQTSTWTWSNIPWGARLKMDPSDFNGLLYEDSNGRWQSVRKKTTSPQTPKGLSRIAVQAMYKALYGEEYPPDRWLFNDFGPTAYRYFRDKNRNRQLDGDERLEGEMFHTTPVNEAEAERFKKEHPKSKEDPAVTMFESHGCIHLKPADRDRLRGAGAFDKGRTLVIHRYDEKAPG